MNTLLLRASLLGTSRNPVPPLETSDPVDQLFVSLRTGSVEEQLLLRAGASATYDLAGQVGVIAEPLAASPPESRRLPDLELTAFLRYAFQPAGFPLAAEFCSELCDAGYVLPPLILPTVLEIRDESLRDLLRPVLGERGRWLAQFRDDWKWVHMHRDSARTSVEDLDASWEVGTLEERIELLKLIRRIDPQHAIAWLSESFAREKVDARKRLLEQLETGLTDADEEFLTSLSSDRSVHVRQQAADLLSQLPNSELTQRMRSRAGDLLRLELKFLGVKIVSSPPQELLKDWENDGIVAKPPAGSGERSWWLRQMLARIPLGHWEAEFQLSPEKIIAAAKSDRFYSPMLSGWTESFARFASRDESVRSWGALLWEEWTRQLSSSPNFPYELLSPLQQIFALLSPDEREKGILRMWTSLPNPLVSAPLVAALPGPWSPRFSKEYLTLTRRLYQSRSDVEAQRWGEGTLGVASARLARETLDQALEAWTINPQTDSARAIQLVERQLREFGERVRVRRGFLNAIESRKSGNSN